MTKFSKFDAADYLDNDEVIAEYIAAAAEDPNIEVFLGAIADVAKARGMAQVAKEAGLGRESLYKSLTKDAQPRFSTVLAVLRALNLRITVQPGAAPKTKKPRRQVGERPIAPVIAANKTTRKRRPHA